MSVISRSLLIESLPEYRDLWVLINKDQDVDDIIEDILDKHKKFAKYYDKICGYFDSDSVKSISDALFNFCKSNIKYVEEKKRSQTTALPTGILIRGQGDCKHYASFIGGILSGLNRNYGHRIKWNYRFVSYNPTEDTPHHVFIVVKDYEGIEYWIDPTPGANEKLPSWYQDIFINDSNMALYSNIGTLNSINSMGFLPALAAVPGAEEAAGGILDSVSGFFKKLFDSFVIGDQVPNYPIKSKNTYTKIMTQIQGEFPDPVSVADAKAKLARAKELAIIMNEKGGSVNVTYSMIYNEVANVLQAYISKYSGTVNPGASPTPPLPPDPKDKSMQTILLVGAAGLGAYILFNKKKKSISGIFGMSTGTLALIAVGGFLAYKYVIGGTASKRKWLTDYMNASTTDTADSKSIFNNLVNNVMTEAEVNDVYSFLHDYFRGENDPNPPVMPQDLKDRLMVISSKYNIFT